MQNEKNDLKEVGENVEKLTLELKELMAALEAGSYTTKDLKGINKEIKKLLNTKGLTYGGVLQVTDHMKDLADQYLTDASKKALSKMNNSQLAQYNEEVGEEHFSGSGNGEVVLTEDDAYVRKVAPAIYMSVTVRRDRVEDGIKAICEEVNEMAEKGWIHSCLAPVSSLDLAHQAFQLETVVVFCFPHIKPEYYEEARKTRFSTGEGGIGPNLHDLKPDLKPGEFLAEARIAHQMTRIVSKTDESVLHDQIQEYLRVLPSGTRFVSYRELAIYDLSKPYELKFHNPLMKDIFKVELDYTRMAVAKEDGAGVDQFNLLTGVRYTTHEGNVIPPLPKFIRS